MAHSQTKKRARPTGEELVVSLRHNESVSQSRRAIVRFCKALRREPGFRATWAAAGGAEGVAQMMADFSVWNVRLLCRHLGRTAGAQAAVTERRAALRELFHILQSGAHGDARPLQACYQDIVPACDRDTVCAYEAAKGDEKKPLEWSHAQNRRLISAHLEHEEARFLHELTTSEKTDIDYSQYDGLFHGNLAFCETVLTTIATTPNAVVGYNFLRDFAMPLISKLFRRRNQTATRIKFLGLVVKAVETHPEALERHLNIQPDGIVYFVIQRWHRRTAETVQEIEDMLARLLRLITIPSHGSLETVYGLALGRNGGWANKGNKKYDPYPLFRFLLLNLKDYRIDIEAESVSALVRPQKPSSKIDLWPMELFMSIPTFQALQLLERLNRADPEGKFLKVRQSSSTLRQAREGGNKFLADVEICRATLLYRLGNRAPNSAWVDRVRVVVQDRRAKANQAREPQDRAFWAASAVNLCVAAGDLQTLDDTITWSRRFDKDPLASRALYLGNTGVLTEELKELLCAIPRDDATTGAGTWKTSATMTLIHKAAKIADGVALELMGAAHVAMAQPGAKSRKHEWAELLNMPHAIMEMRLERSESLKTMAGTESEMIEGIWKPTITMGIAADKLRYPATNNFDKFRLGCWGPLCLYKLPKQTAGSTVAALATFMMDEMRTHYAPEALKGLSSVMVSITKCVAESDQPSLACPFVRRAILESTHDSSWHRELITLGFLSSLPAKIAREFMYEMAAAVGQLMREQSARPWKEGDTQGPVIKVTTIKMMAQILQGNVFLDASSSCDILISLLREARHIDARITITSSLFSVLEDPACAPEIRKRIIESFEATFVPVAARLNERRPVTEEEWNKLPEVGEDTPLLDMFSDRVQTARLSEDERFKLCGFIMDALEQSAENNERWMRVFLSKHNLPLDTVPAGPVNPTVLARMLHKHPAEMTVFLFNKMAESILLNIAPPANIVRVTDLVKSDRELATSNAGKHWLRHFDNPGRRAQNIGLRQAISTLTVSRLSAGNSEVTKERLKQLIVAAATRLALRGDVEVIEVIVERLGEERFKNRDWWTAWQKTCLPVVKDIIATVEGIRGSKNKPPKLVLPNTFSLQTKTLMIPYSSDREPAAIEELEYLAKEVAAMVEKLSERRTLPYHTDLERLRAQLRLIKRPDQVSFAVLLAGIEEVRNEDEPSLADYLRLELTTDLLEGVQGLKGETEAQKVKKLVTIWEECKAEDLRVMGQRVMRVLEKSNSR